LFKRETPRLTWAEIKSATMEHASHDLMDVATRIDARAATRNGVEVGGCEGAWQ
jgi:hypothetical protein